MSDVDSENAANEAKKHTKVARPIHRDKFTGSPRKLKGGDFGHWVRIGEGRWRWEPKRNDELDE